MDTPQIFDFQPLSKGTACGDRQRSEMKINPGAGRGLSNITLTMPKTRQQKEQSVSVLKDKVEAAKSLVFAYYRGLKVKEVEDLRKQCRAEDVEYLVAKKTLLDLAFKDANIEGVSVDSFDKPVATIFGYGDEVAPARIVQKFAKSHESLEVAGGVLEGKFVDSAKVIALSQLPSRDELLAKVVGSINAPVSGFVNVLSGTLRSFVYALNAIKESKQ